MTAAEIALRARSSIARQSSLESRDILRIFAALEYPQVAPLLHTAVHAAPKLLKILDRRDDSAAYNQPEQQNTERVKDRVLRRQDHGADGHDLQNHLRLAQGRRGNCKSFGG